MLLLWIQILINIRPHTYADSIILEEIITEDN